MDPKDFQDAQQVFVVADHSPGADNPRFGTGQSSLVAALTKLDRQGNPGEYIVGSLEKNAFVPRQMSIQAAGLTQEARDAGQSEPVAFSPTINTHPGKRDDPRPNETSSTKTFATPVVRPEKTKGAEVESVGMITDALQVLDGKTTVVIKDDDQLAGHVSFYPSRSPQADQNSVVDVKWRDALTHLKVPSGSMTNVIATSERVAGNTQATALLSMTSDDREQRFAAGDTNEQVRIVAELQAAAERSSGNVAQAYAAEAARLERRLSPGERQRVENQRQGRLLARYTEEEISRLEAGGGTATTVENGYYGMLIKYVDDKGATSFFQVVPQAGGGSALRRVDERVFETGVSSDNVFGNAEVRFGFDSEQDWLGNVLLNGQAPTFTADGTLILPTGGNGRTLRAAISGIPPTTPGEATAGMARAQAELDRLLEMRAAGDPVMNGPEGDRLIRNQQIAIEAYRVASLASTAPLADGSGRNPIATAFNDEITRLLNEKNEPAYDAPVLGILCSAGIGTTEGGKGNPLAYDEIGGALDPNNIKEVIRLSEKGKWAIGHMTRESDSFWRPIVPIDDKIGIGKPPKKKKKPPTGKKPPPPPLPPLPPEDDEEEKVIPPPHKKKRKCGDPYPIGMLLPEPKYGEGKLHNEMPEEDELGMIPCDYPPGNPRRDLYVELGIGRTPIQPKRPAYKPDSDQRERLGAGSEYRGLDNPEPLVPAGGVALLDAFDFHAKMTHLDVINVLANKLNQAISVINGLTTFSTDATNTRALHLPNQVTEPQTTFFSEGDIALVKGRLHVLTTSGKTRAWAPLTQDHKQERWLGSGDDKTDVVIGFNEKLPNDKRAQLVYNPLLRTFTVKNADLVAEGTNTVIGEDGSENEFKTIENGGIEIKARISDVETTRALPVVAGTIPVASSITSEALLMFDGTTGKVIPQTTGAGSTLDADTLDGYDSATTATATSVPVADSSGRLNTWTTAPYWRTYSITYTNLAAAATTNAYTFFTLPARGVIHAVYGEIVTVFGGGALSDYTVEVGIATDSIKYMGILDVGPGGPVIGEARFDLSGKMEDNASTTAIKVTARSGGANLNAATAGVVRISVLVSEVPTS